MYWRRTVIGAPPADPAKYDPGPQPLGTPVVPAQVGELLPEAAGGYAFEAVDEPGDRHGGREVHQQVDVVGFSVELRQFRPRSLRIRPA
jgi:hypothetical protein